MVTVFQENILVMLWCVVYTCLVLCVERIGLAFLKKIYIYFYLFCSIFAEQCRNIEALILNNCKKITDA